MLKLVAAGPKMIMVESSVPEQLQQMLIEQLQGIEMDHWYVPKGVEYMPWQSGVLLVSSEEREQVTTLAFTQPLGVVMSHLLQREDIISLQVLPKLILFNALGNVEAVMNKIQREYGCQRDNLKTLLQSYESDAGVAVVFLEKESGERRSFYHDGLFITDTYDRVFDHLHIHAPRYLAKAFAPNAWHMVDLRVYDRYESYDLQYRRLLKAIDALSLGSIIMETWNREISALSEPIGTYQIRLLTFLEPLELKKRLIGLEYSQDGQRIVDLDLIWHGKKISWKNVLDDKATRKIIKEKESIWPKSSFFSMQHDKAVLVKYCLETLQQMLTAADMEALAQVEQQIIGANQI